MSDPYHPSTLASVLIDPLVTPPPSGVSLLVLNPGGVLTIGTWYEGALAYGYKPQIPASVKARMSPPSHTHKLLME